MSLGSWSRLCAFGLGLALLAPGPAFPQGAGPALPKRDLQGHIKVTVSASGSWPDESDPTVTRSASVLRTAFHRVSFSNVNAFPDNAQGVLVIRGRNHRIEASIQEKWDDETTSGRVNLDCPPDPANPLAYLCSEGAVWFVVVPEENAYYFTFNRVPLECQRTSPTYGLLETRDLDVTGFEKVGPFPLPGKGQPLSGSKTLSITSQDAAAVVYGDPLSVLKKKRRGTEHDFGVVGPFESPEIFPVRIQLEWNFEDPSDDLEVSVEPESGFDAWIPEGNLDDPARPGKNLTLHCYVHRKGEPSQRRKARLEFTWKKVSSEKGVCLNWPSAGASSDTDLQFLKDENRDPNLEVPNPDSARTKGMVEKVDVVVSSLDFGAWGTLHVTARDKDGRDVKVKVRGQEKADLDIPLDENHNHVADAWERRYAGGLKGQETDDDDAEPKGDGHTGDALSLFEEYRGFRVSGGPEQTASGGRPNELVTGLHVRTDPRVKDVFVSDNLGLGLGAFRSAGLQVHLLKPEDCGRSTSGAFNPTIANANRGAFSLGEAYVLWLTSGDAGDTGDYGGAVLKNGSPSVPRDCREIHVNATLRAGVGKMVADAETRITIAHELAHGCNVRHHDGKGLAKSQAEIVRVVYIVDTVENGVVTPAGTEKSCPNGESWTAVANEGSWSSGDLNCVMRYKSTFLEDQAGYLWMFSAAGVKFRGKSLEAENGDYALDRFCGPASTWVLGEEGPPAKGYGDCLHQFCVNHLKH